METHILNGDALTSRMQAAGFTGLVVCRECLIDGPANAASIDDFWNVRAGYIATAFGGTQQDYYNHVVTEYDKLKNSSPDAAIHLWFGDDLFCQANLWFTIEYLHTLGLSSHIFRVFPKIINQQSRWDEFGNQGLAELVASYQTREPFTSNDIQLARNLWKAYAANDFETLKALSFTTSSCFRDLEAVVQAHIDRFPRAGEWGRPERTLKEIMQSGITDFDQLFPAFFRREGIYGFGDTQVKNILAKMN